MMMEKVNSWSLGYANGYKQACLDIIQMLPRAKESKKQHLVLWQECFEKSIHQREFVKQMMKGEIKQGYVYEQDDKGKPRIKTILLSATNEGLYEKIYQRSVMANAFKTVFDLFDAGAMVQKNMEEVGRK